MKNCNGFTLIEMLLAMGIMTIAMSFLINGVQNVETLSSESQQVLEMGKILQTNMETVLSDREEISANTYFYEDYLVEIIVSPYQTTSLFTLQLIITNSFGKSINAIVIYDPDI